MEYTKGSWEAKRNALGTWGVSNNTGKPIAQVERHDDALLIAAAPNQNEALINSNKTLNFLKEKGGFSEHSIGLLEINRAIEVNNEALSKAEGK